MCEESKWLLINSALRSWVKIFPLFCLWRRSLFPLGKQRSQCYRRTSIEYRNLKHTSIPIPMKALCTVFPRRGLGHCGNTSEVFLSTQSQMCDQADRGSIAWDRVFRKPITHLLKEKTHQPDWLARKTELHYMIYCQLDSSALAELGYSTALLASFQQSYMVY